MLPWFVEQHELKKTVLQQFVEQDSFTGVKNKCQNIKKSGVAKSAKKTILICIVWAPIKWPIVQLCVLQIASGTSKKHEKGQNEISQGNHLLFC